MPKLRLCFETKVLRFDAYADDKLIVRLALSTNYNKS